MTATITIPPGMTTLMEWLREDYSDLLAELTPLDLKRIPQKMRELYEDIRWKSPRKIGGTKGTNIYHRVEDKPILEKVLLPYRKRRNGK